MSNVIKVMQDIQRRSAPNRQRKTKTTAPSIEEAFTQMDRWPEAWRGSDEDIPYGKKLVAEMKPFVAYLIDEEGLARKTVLNHLEGLFLLGGEIIRRINFYNDDRKLPPKKLLDDSLNDEGGPLCRHAQEGQTLRSYDAACKKLYRFRSSVK